MPDVIGEIDLPKKRMGFYFICAVQSKPVFRASTELNNEIRCLGAKFSLGWDVKCCLPIYDLCDNRQ